MKSRTFKMFSARTAMLMLATMFSAGAWAQTSEVYGAITISNGAATISGTSDATVNIPDPVPVTSIDCQRIFTPGAAATVFFPFSTSGMTVSGGTFYKFGCVHYNSSADLWIATMPAIQANALEANTPYLFIPTASGLTFNLNGNTVYLQTGASQNNCDCYCWQFVGTYKKKIWVDDYVASISDGVNADCPIVEGTGDYYGFAASDGTAVGGASVSVGDFVKCSGDGTVDGSAYIKPLRAYLEYVGPDGTKDTKKLTRQSGNNIPKRIVVVLQDINGDVTSVGAVSEDTGEITFEGWFTLDGIKLPAEPTKGGIYIHNGKKVVVK
jgi:hypothetical protein